MYLSEIIQKNIPKVRPKDKVSKALEIVSENQLTHVAVVDKKELKGMVTEECLWSMDEEDTVDKASKHYQRFFLNTENLVLDTFQVFELNDSNVIPILNDKEIYQGIVLMEDVVYAFSKYPFIEERGAILEIETPFENYSMEEIARIVESNNAQLFGAIITKMSTETIQLTIKITSEYVSSVGETFERFGYTVKQKYYRDKKQELMEERYKQLQKYMNL